MFNPDKIQYVNALSKLAFDILTGTTYFNLWNLVRYIGWRDSASLVRSFFRGRIDETLNKQLAYIFGIPAEKIKSVFDIFGTAFANRQNATPEMYANFLDALRNILREETEGTEEERQKKLEKLLFFYAFFDALYIHVIGNQVPLEKTDPIALAARDLHALSPPPLCFPKILPVLSADICKIARSRYRAHSKMFKTTTFQTSTP
jgi:hypothetical protein